MLHDCCGRVSIYESLLHDCKGLSHFEICCRNAARCFFYIAMSFCRNAIFILPHHNRNCSMAKCYRRLDELFCNAVKDQLPYRMNICSIARSIMRKHISDCKYAGRVILEHIRAYNTAATILILIFYSAILRQQISDQR